MIQEHPSILCQQEAFEEVADGFQFDSIATERTKWNNLDISNIMDNTEIVVHLIPLTKDNRCIGITLQLNDLTSITHQFDVSVEEFNFVSYDCKQIIGFLIVDGKVSIIITIVSTSINFPALVLSLSYSHTQTHTISLSSLFLLCSITHISPANISLSLSLSLSFCCHLPRWRRLYLIHPR